jgi:hypothetical protein
MLGLERVAAMTRDLLILESQADFLNVARPAIAFYPHSELHGDPTNWHGPNVAALRAMLRAVGFRVVDVVHRPPFHRRLAAAIVRRLRPRSGAPERGPFGSALAQGRVVVHARK